MKKIKKIIAVFTVAVMMMATLAGCGGSSSASNGKILWLANLSSGAQYDFYVAYFEMVCDELGYDFGVIYGDPMNDPAGNLKAVKDAMTSDVKGLIASQDGGIADILEEYPDLFVVGFMTDALSVFGEGDAATSAAAKTNPNFLGTVADGFVSGADQGSLYAQEVISKGYKKVSTIVFPAFAYPSLTEADTQFRADIAAYNATASTADQITIVNDEPTVLMFAALDPSYFLEDGYDDLDCVVGFLAGVSFIYPTLITAQADGSCSADTKLITSGFENNADILADTGDDGTISCISVASFETCIYPMVLLDNAIQGKQFSDLTTQAIDSPVYVMDSTASLNKVVDDSAATSLDFTKLSLSWEDAKTYFTRYNGDATYADLTALMASDKLTVAGIK